VTPRWVGQDPAWWVPFEAVARRRYGSALRIGHDLDRLEYRVCVDVIGRPAATPVLVQVFAEPPYECFGLPPEDFPRVYADLGLLSPHRHSRAALCLYKPTDPPEKRWRSSDGLDVLLELTARHLLLEDGWRATLKQGDGVWAGDEAPHELVEEVGA
jgi:hypothetical protein